VGAARHVARRQLLTSPVVSCPRMHVAPLAIAVVAKRWGFAWVRARRSEHRLIDCARFSNHRQSFSVAVRARATHCAD